MLLLIGLQPGVAVFPIVFSIARIAITAKNRRNWCQPIRVCCRFQFSTFGNCHLGN